VASPPSVASARDASSTDVARLPGATTVRHAPSPPEATCSEPTAAELADIDNKIGSMRALWGEHDAAPIRPVCAERSGWLVEVVTSRSLSGSRTQQPAPTAWLVPAHGVAISLDGWTIGPVYDFDGDGHPEATTIADGGELKIWFDGGARASYVLNGDGAQWLARNGKILVGSGGSAFEIAPGEAYVNGATQASFFHPRTAPAYSCTSDDGQAAAIAHMLTHGRSPAPCAQLPEADKAMQEHAIATALITRRDLDAVIGIHFEWGCTSHGDTPVVVDYDGMRDKTGVELWSVHDGKAIKRDSSESPAPDEYSAHDSIAIGPSGDFDGDGAAESIIEHSHHASAHGTTFAYHVMLGGAMRALPSDLVVRAVVGDRDGVVRTQSFSKPHVVTACHDSDPNTQLDCELQPPAGYVKADSCGPWDWDKHPPQIVALGAATAFAPMSRAGVVAIVAATAEDRAALAMP